MARSWKEYFDRWKKDPQSHPQNSLLSGFHLASEFGFRKTTSSKFLPSESQIQNPPCYCRPAKLYLQCKRQRECFRSKSQLTHPGNYSSWTEVVSKSRSSFKPLTQRPSATWIATLRSTFSPHDWTRWAAPPLCAVDRANQRGKRRLKPDVLLWPEKRCCAMKSYWMSNGSDCWHSPWWTTDLESRL